MLCDKQSGAAPMEPHQSAVFAVRHWRQQRRARLAVLLLNPDDGRQGVGDHDVALLVHRQLPARVQARHQIRLVLPCGASQATIPPDHPWEARCKPGVDGFKRCCDNCARQLRTHNTWDVMCGISLQPVRTLLEAQYVRPVLQPLFMQHDVGPQAGWRPGAPK